MTLLRTIAGRARRLVERSPVGRGLRWLLPVGKEETSYPLFDPDWYRQKNPDVAQAELNPLTHFMQIGAREGRNPSPLFDIRWYRERYPDVARTGVNPLVHYVENGARDRRSPCALFDAPWYLEEYPDAAQPGVNPLLHYLEEGARRGFNPCRLFDTKWYLARYPEVAAAGINPLVHYVEVGARTGFNPCPLFDSRWYLAEHPDVAAAGVNPLAHYIEVGARTGFDPCPLFHSRWYLAEYPEVAAAGVDPLAHYMEVGARTGFDPCPLFDSRWYLAEHPDVAAAGVNPLAHYIEVGAGAGLDPSPLFDTDWYVARYPDVARSGMNPLAHYLRTGLKQGYAPSRYNEVVLLDEFLARGNVTTAARLFAVMDPVPLPNEPARVMLCDLADVRSAVETGGRMLATAEQLAPHLSGSHASPAGAEPRPRIRPAPYLAEIENLLVLPGSATLIDERGRALNDELSLGQEHRACSPGMPDILRAPGRRVLIRFREKAFPIIERGLHLCKEHDHDELHWLVEVLPRLFLAEQVLPEKDVPILVSGSLDPDRRELIDLVRHPDRPVLPLEKSRLQQVRRLVYPSDVCRIGDGPDASSVAVELLDAMIGAIRERAGAPGAGRARRLYLRSGSQQGSIVNERAVEEALVGRGFELLDTRDLSVRARIGLFSDAEAIVGTAGTALANILWCAPSTRALVLHSGDPAAGTTIWDELARTSGVELAHLAGRRVYRRTGKDAAGDSFEMDVPALADRVDALLRRG